MRSASSDRIVRTVLSKCSMVEGFPGSKGVTCLHVSNGLERYVSTGASCLQPVLRLGSGFGDQSLG